MKYKHFYFDMDGTVTENRKEIDFNIATALAMIKKRGNDTIIISAAEKERIKKQLGSLEVSYILAQGGCDSPFWQKKMTERDEVEVWRHIRAIQKRLSEYDWGGAKNWGRFVENRGGQITFSLTGFDCDREIKNSFDPDRNRRQTILKEIPFISLNLECRIGGNTSLDYTHREYNKGKNIKRLIEKMEWHKEECIYFGDSFEKFGNDESVVGVIDHVHVKDPYDLMDKLVELARRGQIAREE